ncbi:unnamed protein product [Polarella glacialis]|uniref:Uncharacterized protein n=1 Tax=Polarella glacialis TaxID=89957 RepID=A0A813DDI5_POLGL|nr:unnamed protein product [Polarella glacialis]
MELRSKRRGQRHLSVRLSQAFLPGAVAISAFATFYFVESPRTFVPLLTAGSKREPGNSQLSSRPVRSFGHAADPFAPSRIQLQEVTADVYGPIAGLVASCLKGVALCALSMIAATWLWTGSPEVASARDGAIAPPTCVSIVNASENCPARPSVGAKKSAELQLAAAQERLAAAEKEAGKKLKIKQSEQGEPEMVEFFKSELKRIEFNTKFLEGLRSQLESPQQSVRLVSRLAIEAPDIIKEENFWCEALGMQRYATLPGGGVVVAYGNPGVRSGEEGAFFAVEIRPLSAEAAGNENAPSLSKGPQLSFVQIATPSLIRISRVLDSGGELVDGYGYYGVKSPAGVQIRAYVEDRRDPVEFVAMVAPAGSMETTSRFLEGQGLQRRGSYELVSKTMQEYMPLLPQGNILFGNGDPKLTVQVLLLPALEDKKPDGNPFTALMAQFGRGPTILMNENSQLEVGILDEKETAVESVSTVKSPRLTIYAAAGAISGSAKQDTVGSAGDIQIQLRDVSEAG